MSSIDETSNEEEKCGEATLRLLPRQQEEDAYKTLHWDAKPKRQNQMGAVIHSFVVTDMKWRERKSSKGRKVATASPVGPEERTIVYVM